MMAASFGYRLDVNGYEWQKVSVTRVTHCIKMKLMKHMTMFKHTILCQIAKLLYAEKFNTTYFHTQKTVITTTVQYSHNSAMRDQLLSAGCEALIQTGTIVTTKIMVVY